MRAILLLSALLCGFCVATLRAASPADSVKDARIVGGMVVQAGSDDLGLKDLGDRFRVRILLQDSAAVEKAQAAIASAGLLGRFTVSTWDGKRLPFADRVINVLVLAADNLVAEPEIARAVAPRGMLISPSGVRTMPVPETIDQWTHYLYDVGGNAVSKDKEVNSPVSFRWWAPPRHLRSHNHGSSFTGLVTANGRVFHFLDEGTWLFDKGGATERWSVVARDAFNGALLWTRPLEGYGQPFFEDVNGQAVPDFIWRTPLSVNRRMVPQGDRVYVALNYREGPLSVLDAATGKTIHAVDLGGIVDEIIAEGDRVICRVRSEIPMPTLDRESRMKLSQQLKKQGKSEDEIKQEPNRRIMEGLMTQKLERVVAVDAATGKVLWQHDAPLVGVQTLAMAGGKVVFYNYQSLVALDAATGQAAWRYDTPIAGERKFYGIRNLMGNLLVADGKVLWTSSATGGGVCLTLADGKEIWKNPRLGTTGGFAFPTALRAINGVIYYDYGNPTSLKDGQAASMPAIGGMLKRGHHIRCFPGKATERFLITPQRGAEFIDLVGDQHMVNDWLRGACSLGNLPANGLFYVTPDPCSCYAGARIYGFNALAPTTPSALETALRPEDPARLTMKSAVPTGALKPSPAGDWPIYRHDARRTAQASSPLAAQIKPAWALSLKDKLTPSTVAAGRVYVARRGACELLCLNAADGAVLWRRAFPAAVDGPPTIVGDRLFMGCRDGAVYSLGAADGAIVWRFLAAPAEILTLNDDAIEGLWPVSSSVLHSAGLIYAVAGRSSYLDGGIHVYALDPASGAVKHYRNLEGPRPDKKGLQTPVLTERDMQEAQADPSKKEAFLKTMSTQYATGYNMQGAEADLLVADEKGDLYLMQTKLTPELQPLPLSRTFHTGLTPMGGMHLLATSGFLDDTMFHRTYWMYDETWPGYGGGSGWAARAGTMVVVGQKQAYAAKQYSGGWYPTHEPGGGNKLVADTFDHKNTSGALVDKEVLRKFNQFGNASEIVRTGAPVWESNTPIIVRAMVVAPDGNGGELLFSAGIVEGKTKAEWDKSTYFQGPGKLLVHNGDDGKLLAEYDLPACPAFDSMSAAGGRLLISLVDGQFVVFSSAP